MTNFDDLIKKATKIAQEEGLFNDDDSTREILPRPGKVKKQSDNASRVVERIAAEIGVGLTETAENIPHDDSLPRIPPQVPQTEHIEQVNTSYALVQPKQEELAPAIDLDDVIQEQVDVLEKWVDENVHQAKRDLIRFWALKIPAIVCSVSVAAFESFGFGVVVILLGVISAFCVSIDALFPGGRLHNVHKRAANEARRLQHDAIGRWRKAQLGRDSDRREAVSNILDFVQKERERIDKYVTDAESSLGVTDK